ncbi:unnamed protein product [Gongylonema pulchrum]|uniref:Uncharacterized protein n=1 Tax=Gongylonema pulchrum TaxID=637853 RepID=A0A3P7MXR1_9BILA|nr:unnamed protein product [Gongylonema pulchrum]
MCNYNNNNNSSDNNDSNSGNDDNNNNNNINNDNNDNNNHNNCYNGNDDNKKSISDVPEKHKELETEIAQLKLRLRERDRVIFDLEEQIRGKDAIIVDKCQLIERLEQPLYDRFSPEGSIEETSQSTIQYMPLINNIGLSVEAKLLEELQEEKNSRAKLVEQNEFLLQQWDEALAYVEQASAREAEGRTTTRKFVN